MPKLPKIQIIVSVNEVLLEHSHTYLPVGLRLLSFSHSRHELKL